MFHISLLSRLGRSSLGVAVAAGVVFGAVQITSANTSNTDESVFIGMTPTRLLDTRQGQTTFDGFDQAVGRLNANSTYELNIAGRAGITQGAVAAVINMVAVNPAAPGYLTVWPCSDSKPLASALNYETGENNANEFSIPIGDDGDICIYAFSATDVVVDVYGYYMASSGTGEQGPTGPQGATGPQGPTGTGITAKGSIKPDVGPPTDKDNPESGDVWIDVNDDAWVWTELDGWDNVGKISGPAGTDGANGQDGAQGPEGPQGPVGTGITVKGTLPNNAAGPPSFNGTDTGDVWIDVADDAWVWTDEGKWDNVGNISGPPGKDGATGSKGDQGDTGPQGLPGADGADGSPNCITDEQIATLSWYDNLCATITVGVNPLGVAFDGTNIWITNRNDNTVTKIDPTTNTVIGDPITVETKPNEVAFDGTNIWVTNMDNGTVTKIDPTTNTVIGDPITVGNTPTGVAFDGTNIWVTNYDGSSLSKIDPTTNTVTTITGVGYPHSVAFDGTNIWVTNYVLDGKVYKINPTTGDVIDSTPVGEFATGVAFDGTHIWVTNYVSDGKVYKVDPTTGDATETITVGNRPVYLAFDGRYVWVTNSEDGTVSKIDPNTNTVTETITVGANPKGVAFDGNNIWVVNSGSNSVSKIRPN